MQRGEIWWADLPEPLGSSPGYRRPVLIVQDDKFNQSFINTVIVAAITGNIRIGKAKGNVLITPNQSGLPKESVINISQLLTVDKTILIEYVSTLSEVKMEQVSEGLRVVLSL